MAMYTPSNQIINFRNRNHNPYRLYKRKKKRKKREKDRPEYSRNFNEAIFTTIGVLGVFENLVIYSLNKTNFKHFM